MVFIWGSSPLARGLPGGVFHRVIHRGIIPARAGFTRACASQSGASGDHPRSRGVYWYENERGGGEFGSSPLARGLLVTFVTTWRPGGIIPARAGFTFHYQQEWKNLQDHPRSRGVYWGRRSLWPRLDGSSPLARGLRLGVDIDNFMGRIIPARAGFTLHDGPNTIPCWDHPRSRGVYHKPRNTRACVVGSSPLARGLLRRVVHRVCDLRIIPARAGFTVEVELYVRFPQDHPRSRGVYARGDAQPVHERGSSPLARGLLIAAVTMGVAIRIIPARAGFTAGLCG